MTQFKVGDKVRHSIRGEMEITYGPYDIGKYIARNSEGTESSVLGGYLTVMPAFTAGDKAKMHGESDPVEIVAGPFRNRYMKWYVVRAGVGETTAAEGNLTAIPDDAIKVGDRVRVTDDDGGGSFRFTGRIGIVKRMNVGDFLPYLIEFGDGRGGHGAVNGRWNCKAVERVTDAESDSHTVDGITYDLTAQYRDRDGDTWTLKRVDGTVRASMGGSPVTVDSHSLSYIARNYSPLVKI